MSNRNPTMFDIHYTPTVVPYATALTILDSGDPLKMMDLPTAWFEDGNDRHRVRVNPIAAGLRAIERGASDIRELRAATREMAKDMAFEYLNELEQISDDELEVIDFACGTATPCVLEERMGLLRTAADRIGAPLPRVLAEILGRTLH